MEYQPLSQEELQVINHYLDRGELAKVIMQVRGNIKWPSAKVMASQWRSGKLVDYEIMKEVMKIVNPRIKIRNRFKEMIERCS